MMAETHSARTIRAVRWEDLDTICRIEVESNAAWAWTRALFESELTRQYGRFFLCESDHSILGYVSFWAAPMGAEILTIVVSNQMRRRGIAQELLDHVKRECRQLGSPSIDLEVHQENRNARKLYEKNGFIDVGVRKGYYRDGGDAILMHCDL